MRSIVRDEDKKYTLHSPNNRKPNPPELRFCRYCDAEVSDEECSHWNYEHDPRRDRNPPETKDR